MIERMKRMEKLASIKEEGLKQIEACEDLAQLQNLRVLYLGKKDQYRK